MTYSENTYHERNTTMDLTERIDYFLPRVPPRKIKRIARRSWGAPNPKMSFRLALRLLEFLLSMLMPKPEKELKRLEDGSFAVGYPVIYHGDHLLIMPMYGIKYPRTYVLFNAMTLLLKKR